MSSRETHYALVSAQRVHRFRNGSRMPMHDPGVRIFSGVEHPSRSVPEIFVGCEKDTFAVGAGDGLRDMPEAITFQQVDEAMADLFHDARSIVDQRRVNLDERLAEPGFQIGISGGALQPRPWGRTDFDHLFRPLDHVR